MQNQVLEIIDKVTDEKIKEELQQILYQYDKKEQAEDKKSDLFVLDLLLLFMLIVRIENI